MIGTWNVCDVTLPVSTLQTWLPVTRYIIGNNTPIFVPIESGYSSVHPETISGKKIIKFSLFGRGGQNRKI